MCHEPIYTMLLTVVIFEGCNYRGLCLFTFSTDFLKLLMPFYIMCQFSLPLNSKFVSSLYSAEFKEKKFKRPPVCVLGERGSLIKMRVWNYLEEKRLPAPDLQSSA